MLLDEKTFFTLSANRKSLFAIGMLFQLTEEEMNHPNCGEWIVDCIKQLQTAQLVLKSLTMRRNENQNIENYTPNPFKEKENPLLIPEANSEKLI